MGIISAGATLKEVGGGDGVMLQVRRAQPDPDVSLGGGMPPRNRFSLEERKETVEGSLMVVKSPRAIFLAPIMRCGMNRAGGRRGVSCCDAALAASF
ncbi:hypothetical protein CYMTET_3832 [Cymbomonas tetramitiformis]|uniref:Uncharacterized protein n=1 Tax=Cymbomonas tetramitiformis TaxID=36881 RepID=A0AAE0H2K4_9CHLO|nr:hypothetical protein CYMTET_3832 [Cymbomonas tetramitiformis]